ncbi:hypothetical protein HHK36_022786 [Tetracentron sinense]|uniref:Uncharacterized protein n=1 Tax=Tetracentron sinense TaxID=13715 RepID=A0A834YNG6_TETSI|nr:hypothetical protein HHK36_022786 [Tetracentron sinense]
MENRASIRSRIIPDNLILNLVLNVETGKQRFNPISCNLFHREGVLLLFLYPPVQSTFTVGVGDEDVDVVGGVSVGVEMLVGVELEMVDGDGVGVGVCDMTSFSVSSSTVQENSELAVTYSLASSSELAEGAPSSRGGNGGSRCLGVNVQNGEEVAVKLESVETEHPQLRHESKLYRLLQGGIERRNPLRIVYNGLCGDHSSLIRIFSYIVMMMNIRGQRSLVTRGVQNPIRRS